ncbi:MAG: bifunctional phosphopantothenoylcysteine decarboxylase/phosphopantothenate--cysteine ligase CoaBC [Crocinitomicaceae bacterium]|nr:bifunctional phosphopantothenoylcysteine decarboxylase/phosphopantothenate--cysteine ligase CoaBC [Crocinitomicaceae bacterium]
MLKGKKIILGITGSIAAYKAAFLVRELTKEGAEVKVIMTQDSTEFITPLTLSTLSNNPVLIDWKDASDNWNNHVELGLWADLLLIAPCTANTLAKMNSGICDNLLMATYLSAKCPVAFAPAMDLDMFQHFTTQNNISNLVTHGCHLIDSEEGELASGLVGKGRMAEPENIVQFVQDFFKPQSNQKKKLKNKRILITAGPTYEAIDPVRFIGNRSSGKMGIEIARKASEMGAKVHLVLGPSQETTIDLKDCKVTRVESAEEMFKIVSENIKKLDIGIFSAAVADYRPKNPANQKIKKKGETLDLELIKNPDILKYAGEQKAKFGYKLVGFALETNNEEENAISKLEKKNLDLIVLNSLQDKGAGFSTNTNKISIIDRHNKILKFELKSKAEVAEDILNVIVNEF